MRINPQHTKAADVWEDKAALVARRVSALCIICLPSKHRGLSLVPSTHKKAECGNSYL